jgi:hypothetical protein
MTDYKGIDYSLGLGANTDTSNGIRYGVISQYSVGEAWYEDAEADYGKAHCPKCGNAAIPTPTRTVNGEHGVAIYYAPKEAWSAYEDHGSEYACELCEYLFDSDEAFGDEPVSYYYQSDEYSLVDCLDTDIMVLKAPYYTYAQFCSPCVPGAGNLNAPCVDGVRCYCLGHEWFESQAAPYPVYCVDDDILVLP